jgi:hypothetical protein
VGIFERQDNDGAPTGRPANHTDFDELGAEPLEGSGFEAEISDAHFGEQE